MNRSQFSVVKCEMQALPGRRLWGYELRDGCCWRLCHNARGMKFVRYLVLAGWLAADPGPVAAASAVFGGGPFYSGGVSVMDTLRASGFTTVVLWCIHVDSASGDLILNDQLVVANGGYVGNAAWPAQLGTLKVAPTSVNRIEVSVGSWGVNDFLSIQSLLNSQGTNSSSILYRNFQALKTATGADAIDFDDETLYDVVTTVQFGRMLSSLGYKVTLCPYTNPGFWQSVYNQLGSIVDVVYLQCYAGGTGNNPTSWNSYFPGLNVSPGLWCCNGTGCTSGDNPASVAATMRGWKTTANIPGGFMWLYDDMQSCASQGTPAAYAYAINEAVPSPPVIVNPIMQPQGPIYAGTSLILTASVDGTWPISYQWYKGGIPISTATNATYRVDNVTTNYAGSYTVIARNLAGGATSTPPAMVTVVTAPAGGTGGNSGRRTRSLLADG